MTLWTGALFSLCLHWGPSLWADAHSTTWRPQGTGRGLAEQLSNAAPGGRASGFLFPQQRWVSGGEEAPIQSLGGLKLA